MKDLMQQAVEAAHWALPGTICAFDEDTGLFEDIDCPPPGSGVVQRDEEAIVGAMLAAAEPLIRAQVVQEIVAWYPPCPTCKGWGHVPDSTGRPEYIAKDDPPCPVCSGSGVGGTP